MKLQSFRIKLLLSVFTLVLGSGLLIAHLVTQRYSKSLFAAMIAQGEYLSQALAFEAAEKILTNDLVSLQRLLDSQLQGNSGVSYCFVLKNEQVLAHTFSSDFPAQLLGVHTESIPEDGSHRRIASTGDEYFLDFAWPIFSGKAGILRLGFSEKPYRKQIARIWQQIALLTLGVLAVALAASVLFIGRFTKPLMKLSEAAESIDAGNLQLAVVPAGKDEVGRLTDAFNKMVERIRRHTSELESKARELDRAHQQMHSSFEIIQKISAQTNLQDICAYLITRFRNIVSCSHFAFMIYGIEKQYLLICTEAEVTMNKTAAAEDILPLLSGLTERTQLPPNPIMVPVLSDRFREASRLAAFPILHEHQNIGAMIIGCPGACRCEEKDQAVIELILSQTAGAMTRAVRHEQQAREFQCRIEESNNYCELVGRDPKMQTIYKLIEDIGPTDATVLIQGESGTGKELVARAVHTKSLRSRGPFVVINCSAYPATLLESELFGHEKGAFTGAVRRKKGLFERADSGTVFLDEIGEVPSSAQIKLLRVLQTQKFERLGGEQTLTVDTRIISATNKELLEEVKQGRFREDLYYRLNVIPINLPPLRERRNDIPILSRHFQRRFAAEQEKDIRTFSPDAMRQLLDYQWPGNVRELENSIEHAVVLAKGRRIQVSDLPSAIAGSLPVTEAKTKTAGKYTENEVTLIREALNECNWNKKEAARRLGISRSTLYNKIRKYRISPPTIH